MRRAMGPVLMFVVVLGLLLLSALSTAFAADIGLAWDAPTQNCDGSLITDLAGYRVWWGAEPRPVNTGPQVGWPHPEQACDTSGIVQWLYPEVKVVNGAVQTTVTISEVEEEQTIYFSVTALDIHGNESGYSNEISVVVPPLGIAPAPPMNLRLGF